MLSDWFPWCRRYIFFFRLAFWCRFRLFFIDAMFMMPKWFWFRFHFLSIYTFLSLLILRYFHFLAWLIHYADSVISSFIYFIFRFFWFRLLFSLSIFCHFRHFLWYHFEVIIFAPLRCRMLILIFIFEGLSRLFSDAALADFIYFLFSLISIHFLLFFLFLFGAFAFILSVDAITFLRH